MLGSGNVEELDIETPEGDDGQSPSNCSDDLADAVEPASTLPAPIQPQPVGGTGCGDDPDLIGSGDCSNSIEKFFMTTSTASDYIEMRMEGDAPANVSSLHFDFAFFSTEYPQYLGQSYADMLLVWLESESWTGNVVFDSAGNPMTINSELLDFKDEDGTLAELDGTCMRQHSGTNWHSTKAPVTAGGSFTLVFSIFDIADAIIDSYVFIDDVRWGCEVLSAPSTK